MDKHPTLSTLSKIFFLFFLFVSFRLPDGLKYKCIQTNEPVCIHILEVDPTLFDIKPAIACDQGIGVETLSSIATRKQALAGVNGGFFQMKGPHIGISSGALKINNTWFFSQLKPRGAIGWNNHNQTPYIDRLAMKMYLNSDSTTFSIDAINQSRLEDNAVLYLPTFDKTTLTNNGKEITLNAALEVMETSENGNSCIPKNGYVFSIGQKSDLYYSFHSLHFLTLHIEVFPLLHPELFEFWNRVDHIVSGTPVLITEGKILNFEDEKIALSFIYEKHPRTAVGIKKNGNWIFLVIDGRNPEKSVGATLQELAECLLSLGCYNALNLDGGGSSSLFLLDQIVSIPSGNLSEATNEKVGIERPIGDAILIFPKN